MTSLCVTMALAALLRADADGGCPVVPSHAPPFARVTMNLDATTSAIFEVQSFDLVLGVVPVLSGGRRRAAGATPGAELRLTKPAGLHTGTLTNATATGRTIPSVTIDVLDAAGAATMSLRLFDVTVAADHIVLSPTRLVLQQQLLSLQESLTQLASDLQDAQRQQGAAETLGKTRAAAALELSRARERTSELSQRLALAKQRYALLGRQVDSKGEIEEEVTLRFARVEVDSKQPGGAGTWGPATAPAR